MKTQPTNTKEKTMTQKEAHRLHIGDWVQVAVWTIHGGLPTKVQITAVDNPSREFGVRHDGRKYSTVFNTEICFAC